jgi:hypothetical protein
MMAGILPIYGPAMGMISARAANTASSSQKRTPMAPNPTAKAAPMHNMISSSPRTQAPSLSSTSSQMVSPRSRWRAGSSRSMVRRIASRSEIQ